MVRTWMIVAGAVTAALFLALLFISRPNYCWTWEAACEVDWPAWWQCLGIGAALLGIWMPLVHADRRHLELRRETLFSAMDAANQVASGLGELRKRMTDEQPVPDVWLSLLDLPAESLRSFSHSAHVLKAEEQKWLRLLAMQLHAGKVAVLHTMTPLQPEQWAHIRGSLQETEDNALEHYASFKTAAEAVADRLGR